MYQIGLLYVLLKKMQYAKNYGSTVFNVRKLYWNKKCQMHYHRANWKKQL